MCWRVCWRCAGGAWAVRWRRKVFDTLSNVSNAVGSSAIRDAVRRPPVSLTCPVDTCWTNLQHGGYSTEAPWALPCSGCPPMDACGFVCCFMDACGLSQQVSGKAAPEPRWFALIDQSFVDICIKWFCAGRMHRRMHRCRSPTRGRAIPNVGIDH